MPRGLKKVLAWGVWGLNLAIIVWAWSQGKGPDGIEDGFKEGEIALVIHGFGLLLGLLATFCALTQLILMGRVGWLEPIFGMDRLAIFHRLNGYATLLLVMTHAACMASSYTILAGGKLVFLDLPYVWLAIIAELLLITTVGLSIYIVRKRLKFETWYAVHLLNYVAVAIIPFHQFVNGLTLRRDDTFATYWLGLYIFVALNLIIWRFGMTLVKYLRHDFKVQNVVAETPTSTSIYIAGRKLEDFKAKAGQFVLVRFLSKHFVWQEHPFSLSMMPGDGHLRITIRHLGDFTNLLPVVKVGTPVWVSGPFGAFTHQLQTKNKVLYIAGGIGITPIRSMIEERARQGKGDAILLYGNRTKADTALLPELQTFAGQIGMPIHNVLSEQKDYAGEKGYVDQEKIARLVPDVAERDIFLCGPPPMMEGVKKALKNLGVPKRQIHYERFALHSK